MNRAKIQTLFDKFEFIARCVPIDRVESMEVKGIDIAILTIDRAAG